LLEYLLLFDGPPAPLYQENKDVKCAWRERYGSPVFFDAKILAINDYIIEAVAGRFCFG
jgi:hypothetical protein